MAVPSAYRVVLDENRRQLDRLTIKQGAGRLFEMYNQAQRELLQRLSRLAPGRTPFTEYQLQHMLGQVKAGVAQLAVNMAGELGTVTKEVQTESLTKVISSVEKLENHFKGTTPVLRVREASRFAGVIDQRRTSLLRMHRSSMAAYGATLVGEIEGGMAQSIISGDTFDGAIGRVRDIADGEWWQAERIVRTESAWAYNATHADGIAEVQKDVPDIWQRWTEHVTDGGTPLDDRVGEDSIAMHGQVTRPGGVFTMPDDPKVSQTLWGKQWAFPPDRPNDRAVLVPWSPTWGVPGWQLIDGVKVPVR